MSESFQREEIAVTHLSLCDITASRDLRLNVFKWKRYCTCCAGCNLREIIEGIFIRPIRFLTRKKNSWLDSVRAVVRSTIDSSISGRNYTGNYLYRVASHVSLIKSIRAVCKGEKRILLNFLPVEIVCETRVFAMISWIFQSRER